MNVDEINETYTKLTEAIYDELERRARDVLAKDPSLIQFLNGNGLTAFVDDHGNLLHSSDHPAFSDVNSWVDRWDFLKLDCWAMCFDTNEPNQYTFEEN